MPMKRKVMAKPKAFFFCILPLFVLLGCATPNHHGSFSIDDRKRMGVVLVVDEKLPLAQRVKKIPDAVRSVWQTADLQMNPQAKLYSNHTLSEEEKDKLAEAVAMLPKSWQAVMQKKLVNFYFVDALLGGGITDWVVNAKGQLSYTMILNPDIFTYSAKEWLEIRANGTFEAGEYRLAIDSLESISALQYILWHEAAHVIDFEHHYTLGNDPLIRQYFKSEAKSSPFMDGVWVIGGKQLYQPVSVFNFPTRKMVNPYFMNIHKKQVSNVAMLQSFKDWQNTPFVTLYAATSWAEDYADNAAFRLAQKQTGEGPVWQLTHKKKVMGSFSPLLHPINMQRSLVLD